MPRWKQHFITVMLAGVALLLALNPFSYEHPTNNQHYNGLPHNHLRAVFDLELTTGVHTLRESGAPRTGQSRNIVFVYSEVNKKSIVAIGSLWLSYERAYSQQTMRRESGQWINLGFNETKNAITALEFELKPMTEPGAWQVVEEVLASPNGFKTETRYNKPGLASLFTSVICLLLALWRSPALVRDLRYRLNDSCCDNCGYQFGELDTCPECGGSTALESGI